MSDNQVTEPSETATPETDARAVIVKPVAAASLCEDWDEAVDADFARKLETERDQLRADVEELKERIDIMHKASAQTLQDTVGDYRRLLNELNRLRAENATLTAALDKAREDSKRLDWLEANATSELKIDSDGTFVWLDQWRQKYTSFYQWSGPTLRAALDAAKGAE